MVLGNNSSGHLFDTSFTTEGVLYSAASGVITSTAAGTAGQMLQSAGNASPPAYSTPTYPSGSGTSRKIIVSNGTNNVYSTETWAVPGTNGNVLTSDGTNWTSAAPAGGGGVAGTNSFLATLTSVQASKTGNGTIYTIPFDTAIFNNGSNYNTSTGVYTAPATGIYYFSATILTQAQTAAAPTPQLAITATASAITYRADAIATAAGQNIPYTINGTIAMTAGDTAQITINIGGGGTDSTNIFGAAGPTAYTSFSGFRVA